MALKAKDIAQDLGISPATVSLVINNKPGVGEETRKMILDRIVELNCEYLLRDAAEAGAKENTVVNGDYLQTIAFVIYIKGGELMEQTPFLPYMLGGIENAARGYGYSLAILTISADWDEEEKRNAILNSKCVGFVVFATELQNDADISVFESMGIPFVILDNYFSNRPITCVTLNNEQGIQKLVEHLLECGHRRIGFLDSGLSIQSFKERKEYCLWAFHRAGILQCEELSYTIGYPILNAYTGMKNILAQKKDLATAYLADNDIVAIGAIEALKEYGYRIPQDIAVAGFDDRPDCLTCEPKLTTVRIPRASFGAEAIELLVNQILRMKRGTKILGSRKLELGVELIIRESTKAV